MAIARLKQHDLVEQYAQWIKDNTYIYQHPNDVLELTTPFLDSHNDALQIYVKNDASGTLRISDGGYMLSDLEMSGISISTKSRERIMKEMISSFGVSLSDQDDLYILATVDNFAQKKHCLIQAMLAISDMYILSRGVVKEVFKDDVRDFLDQYEIRYTADIIMKGRSGFEHNIDFVIPRSSGQPERIIQVYSRPTKATAQSLLFSVNELREVRREQFKPFVFSKENVPKSIASAFGEYDLGLISWETKESFIPALSA